MVGNIYFKSNELDKENPLAGLNGNVIIFSDLIAKHTEWQNNIDNANRTVLKARYSVPI